METIEGSLEIILIAVAFIAGAIDAIAGGGGLIVMPALLLSGMPVVTALGTSKLQAVFGSASATLHYARKGLVDLRTQWKAALLCAVLAFFGAKLVAFLPKEILTIALPIILILVALFFAFAPRLSDDDKTARMKPVAFAMLIAPMIGFYDGIFGPGAGTFYMLGFVGLAGYGLTRATAHTKLLNLSSNIGALIAFMLLGAVDYKLGLMMGVAQFLGARLGAGMAVKNGAKLIRPLLVVTSIVLAIKLIIN